MSSTIPTTDLQPADNMALAKIFGALLRRIDYHAAHLGAGHAAHFERGEVSETHLEKTYDVLQAIAALVDEAKEKVGQLEPTISPVNH